ncbi:hypothetical protein CGRA01v4_10668 [Colletotrichum graminicola]|nr:hypothetical protein CGRA01v4_10668 [Colletotrichum graminicola]
MVLFLVSQALPRPPSKSPPSLLTSYNISFHTDPFGQRRLSQ